MATSRVEDPKRRRVADALPVAHTFGDPVVAVNAAGGWQGWDEDAFWASLFNPLPLAEAAESHDTLQESSSRKRGKLPHLT
jgi:hypothetical protein